jgi:hypothetical protein
MRELAGERRIDAALDAGAPPGAPPHETHDHAKRRRLRQAAARTRAYLNQMRRGTKA